MSRRVGGDKDAYKDVSTRVVGQDMPEGYMWINTFASPSVFAQVDGEQLVMAEINVRIRVIFDIT